MSDWTEGVQIPITTPGGSEAATVLRALAEAMKAVGIETTVAGEKASATRTAFSFNEIRAAAMNLYGDVVRLADGIAALATEQAQLDANSARLKLDFNAASDAAGRFTDETDAMAAATRLAEVGLSLTQDQLNSMTVVAARFSQNTGTSMASALDALTTGLITGSQRGLRPFGGELAAIAGHSHTAEERLAALATQAANTTQATDDAASSMERLRDNIGDAARTLATGFAEGLTEMSRLSATAEDTGNHFEILTSDIHEAGRNVALVFGAIANGLGVLVGGIATGVASMLSMVVAGASAAGAVVDRLRSGHVTGLGAAATSAFGASMSDSPITAALRGFTQARLDAVDNIGAAIMSGPTETRPSSTVAGLRGRDRGGEDGGGRAEERMKSAKADQLAMEHALTAAYEAERQALQRLRETEARETEARDAARRTELDRLTDRLRAQQEREKAESVEGARATRETERLRREQQRRLDMTQTYVERMRDLHGQEFDSTHALAEGVTGAFQGMGKAFGDHLQAFVTGKETIGDALQGMLSDTLASIAQQATVKGALELAEGIAALAGIVTAPLAPGHFAAAGVYFGVAALAGVGAAAVAPSSSPSVAAPASAPREPAARLPKGGASGGEGGTVYNVTFGGPMYGTGGVRQAARQMVGAINRGAVQGGVQLLPGVLMGGGAGS